jgi:hypothetical protein
LPKLRELSLSAVHVDWDDASDAFVCHRNFRKLELKNQTYDGGQSFEEFPAILSSSPRLEYLDASGFCPEHHTGPDPPAGGAPEVPVVHLPALKDFIFTWKDIDRDCLFLWIFQIGGLIGTSHPLGHRIRLWPWGDETGGRHWNEESQTIFEALYELGSAALRNEEDMPSGPCIAMRGVKRLKTAWTEATLFSLTPFLETLTEVEDI